MYIHHAYAFVFVRKALYIRYASAVRIHDVHIYEIYIRPYARSCVMRDPYISTAPMTYGKVTFTVPVILSQFNFL